MPPDSRPGNTKTALLAALAFSAAAGALIFARLTALPGLSADEAWVGLRAMEFQKRGLFTPDGMNWYTGPLHAWLVAHCFDWLGPGMFALRLPGALLNTFAAGLAAFFVTLEFGLAGAGVLAAIFLALPFYALQARIAWEVCALQNILCVAAVFPALAMAKRGRTGLAGAALFSLACAIGVTNHLIFLALPLGLALGLALWQAESGDRRFEKPAVLSILNIAALAAIMAAKKHITEAAWQQHRALALTLFAALPLAAAFAAWRWQDSLGKRLSELSARLFAGEKPRRALRWLAGAGLAAALWFHGTAFFGALGGINVFKRFFSLDAGLLATTALFLGAALACGAVFTEAFAALRRRDGDAARLFISLTLAGVFIAFTLLRNTNSMRYYIVPFFVFALAAAALLPQWLRGASRKNRLFLALCAAFALAVSLREIAAPQTRRPLNFRQGWHGETSARMMDIAWLAEKMKNEGICIFSGDEFITLPLQFMYESNPWPCRAEREFRGEYCYTCQEPPYIR